MGEVFFVSKSVELDSVPIKLKESVESYLESYSDVKLLAIEQVSTKPYVDKTIIQDTYSVYLNRGNLFTVMKISICSNPEWSDREVRENLMIAADITKFVELGGAWFAELNGWKP